MAVTTRDRNIFIFFKIYCAMSYEHHSTFHLTELQEMHVTVEANSYSSLLCIFETRTINLDPS